MKRKSLGLAFIATLVVVVGAACFNLPGSSTTVITNTNTNNQGGSSPAPGASPSPGPTGVINEVKVTQFGEGCPSGTQPSGEPRSVRVGCQKFLTCTPFMPGHIMAPPEVHGPAPTSFEASVGEGTFVQTTRPEEAFNRDAKGILPGIATYVCVVKGVTSEPFDLRVIQ